MLQLQFPEPDFRIRAGQDADEIFDPIRKKWVVLTPEEWVRQNVLSWLVNVLQVPSKLIAVERAISVGELKRRFDIVVFGRNMQPWLLAECKAMDVELSEKTVSQVLSYQSALPAGMFMVTNGHFSYAWRISGQGAEMLFEIPNY